MNKSPQYTQYLVISTAILRLDLNANSKLVFAYIESFYNKPNKVFNASNQFIANELCMSLATVKRALTELEHKDYIRIEYITHKWGKSKRVIYSKERERALKAIDYFNKTYGKK